MVTASGQSEDIANEARGMGAVSVTVDAMPLKDMFLETVAAED